MNARFLMPGLALAAASSAAFAQADKCSTLPENLRARCEEDQRVNQKCAELEKCAVAHGARVAPR